MGSCDLPGAGTRPDYHYREAAISDLVLRLVRAFAGTFGRVPYVSRAAGAFLGDPLPALGWKPFARRQLVYDLPFRKLAIVNDHQTVEAIMMDRESAFPKSAIVHDLLQPLIGDGVFGQPGGDRVKEVRRLMARALAQVPQDEIVSTSRAMATAYADDWLREVSGQAPAMAPVGTDLSRMTVDIVSLCTLGDRFEASESARFSALFSAYHRKAKPVLLMLARNDARARSSIIRESGLPAIGSEMRAMIRSRFLGAGAKRSAPFARALEAEGLLSEASGDRALDEIAVMLLAGHETTASTLSWLFYELANRPGLQEGAASVVRGTVGDRQSPSQPGFADRTADEVIGSLTNETLRLYPPIGFFLRDSVQPVGLEEASIGSGDLMLVAPRTIHRHKDYWPEPDAFQPERWFSETTMPRGSFIPFGMGARVCPGARFAAVEMNEICRVLLERARFAPGNGKQPHPQWNLTARPDPDISLKVLARAPVDTQRKGLKH